MKTIREVELEYKVRDLERQLRAAKGEAGVYFEEDDDLQGVTLRVCERQLPMVLRMYARQGFGEPLRVLGCAEGRNAEKLDINYGYFLADGVIATKAHLERALIDMHERLIENIAAKRRGM